MAQNQQRRPGRDIAVVHPPRLPYPAEAANEGVSPGQWKALTDAIFPAAKTVDGVMLAINYARARNLDIFKRVVHVVPMWNSSLRQEVDTVWPGIGELRTTASRTTAWAGNDECTFGPDKRQKFEASREREGRDGQGKQVDRASCDEMVYPEWAQITVYKMVQGQRVAFVGPRVRFTETFSGVKGLRVPNERWQQAPYQMLEKCAEAAALRRAFPEELGDMWVAEEMEGKETKYAPGEFTVVDEGPAAAEDQARPRPTDKKSFGADVDKVLATVQTKIDQTNNPEHLVDAMQQTISGRTADGWKKPALKELERRFRDRIASLVGEDPDWYAKHLPTEKQKAAAGAAEHDDDEGAELERTVAYVDEYIHACRTRVGSVPDLNSYESEQKAAVAALQPDWAERCHMALTVAKRLTLSGESSEKFDAELAAERSSTSAGAPAAADDDSSPAGEE
jgi:phage recombination protein Bet